jgi:hypothetical protein
MVPLREVANLVGDQVQYLSRYHVGGRVVLSDGLRLSGGENGDYHSIRIHKDDVEEFARRIVKRRINVGNISPKASSELEEKIERRRQDLTGAQGQASEASTATATSRDGPS